MNRMFEILPWSQKHSYILPMACQVPSKAAGKETMMSLLIRHIQKYSQ